LLKNDVEIYFVFTTATAKRTSHGGQRHNQGFELWAIPPI